MGSLRPQQTVAAPFGAGNIVVYRVGDGNSTLVNTGNQVFLDEYTPAGVLVRSIPMPTAPDGNNNPLIASGVAGSEGGLNLSADGRYLILAGYNSQIPAASSLASSDAAVVNRVIGRVDAQGNVNTTTTLNNFAAFDNPREVASDNGTRFWGVSGNGSATDPAGLGGVFYTTLGATSGISITNSADILVASNLRSVNVFGGQLYVSSQQGEGRGIMTVGSGLPTTAGQPLTLLPDFASYTRGTTIIPTMRDFVMLDLNAGVAGLDTIYAANEYNGLRKYTFNGTSWALSGVVDDGDGTTIGTGNPQEGDNVYRRITASVSGNTVTLFATRYQVITVAQDPAEQIGRLMITAETDGELVRLTDTSGPTGSFNGAASMTVMVPAAANKAIRGVAIAPVDPTAPTPTNTTAPVVTNTPTNTTEPSATATTDPAASPTATATTDPSQPTATATTTAQPTATTDPESGPQNPVWLPLLHK